MLMSVLNSVYLLASLMSFFLVVLTGPLDTLDTHDEFLEMPVMVLHLVLLCVVLAYLGFSFLSFAIIAVPLFSSPILTDDDVILILTCVCQALQVLLSS